MYTAQHSMVAEDWGWRCWWSQLVTWDYYSHCTSGRWWRWGWESLLHWQSSWGSSSDPPLQYQLELSSQRQRELWNSRRIVWSFLSQIFDWKQGNKNMKLTHNPNKVQSSTSVQQHNVGQEIFIVKMFCHFSSMPKTKNMKTFHKWIRYIICWWSSGSYRIAIFCH